MSLFSTFLFAFCKTVSAMLLVSTSLTVLAIQSPDQAFSNIELLEQAYSSRSSQPQKSQDLLSQISRQSLNEAEQDKYDFVSAYLLFMNRRVTDAIAAFETLAETGHTPAQRFNAHAALGSLYAGTQNWSKGFRTLDYLFENIDIIDSLEAEEQAHFAVINLYSQLNENETLAQYIEPLLDKPYSKRFKCIANMQMLAAQIDFDIQSLSEQNFNDALARCEASSEKIANLGVYNQQAIYLFNIGKTERALAILNEHLEAITSSGYEPLLDDFHMLLSQAYFEKGDYERAKQFALLIVGEQANDNLVSRSDVAALEVLFQVFEQEQNYKQAFEYAKQYAQAKTLNVSSENAKMLSIQKAKQDSEQKSNQIALLDAENSLLKTQAQLGEEAARNRQLIIAILLLVFFFVGLWIYKRHANYKKFKEIARKDGLTGIANRHYFTSKANALVTRLEKSEKPVSLILFDLDNFKLINDSYGHSIGDEALQAAVDAALKACRANDLIGRLGGEEFGILLEDCALSKAMELAEACRHQIEQTNIAEDQSYVLTASFGVASSDDCGYSFDTLFDDADRALYQAKSKGKNIVEHT